MKHLLCAGDWGWQGFVLEVLEVEPNTCSAYAENLPLDENEFYAPHGMQGLIACLSVSSAYAKDMGTYANASHSSAYRPTSELGAPRLDLVLAQHMPSRFHAYPGSFR